MGSHKDHRGIRGYWETGSVLSVPSVANQRCFRDFGILDRPEKQLPGEAGDRRRGVALLLAILAAGIISIGAAVVLVKVERETASDRIREYNFILEQYRKALSLFQARFDRLPKDLRELVDNEKRIWFIRRLYADPFTGGPLSLRRKLTDEIEDVYSETASRLFQGT